MNRSADLLETGQVVADRYEILDLLGAGGFSVVYKARQLSTGKLVAVKVLLPDRLDDEEQAPQEIARFEREMRTIAGVKHPHIVPLIDSGHISDDQLFIVLEFIEGETLGDLIKRKGSLDVRETKRLMTEVLDALAAAHGLGIVHRDLKPQNIMLTRSGMRRVAMVLDFGVAGILEDFRHDDYAELTGEGQVPGTPAYMAPEQIRTDILDPQSDIYAWGLVFVECLTGRKAFGTSSLAKTIAQQLSPAPVPIPEPLREHALGAILRGATAKDTAARFKTTAEILPALEACDIDDALVESMQDYLTQNPPPALSGKRRLDSRGSTQTPGDLVDSNAATRIPTASDQPTSLSGRRRTKSQPNEMRLDEISVSSDKGLTPIKQEPGPSRKSAVLVGALIGLLVAAVAAAFLLGLFDPTTGDNDEESATDGRETTQTDNNQGEEDNTTDNRDVEESPPDTSAMAQLQDVASEEVKDTDEPEADIAPEPVDLATACQDGDTEACLKHADELLAVEDPNYAAVGRALQSACMKDNMAGCVRFGELFEYGNGVAADKGRAMQLYKRACKAKEGLGCGHAGLMYLDGRGVREDTEEAISWFRKGCDLDDAESCGELGNLVLRGRGGLDADTTRAAELMNKACDEGHARSCSRVGSMLMEGDGVPIDAMTGLQKLIRSCDLGYARGCSKVAYTYARGLGVAQDPKAAAEFYVKGCNQGLESACASVCYMYQVGDGVEENHEKARELCRLSCQGSGDPTGCYRYGLMVRDGFGGESDPEAAKTAFRKACRGGERKACRLR